MIGELVARLKQSRVMTSGFEFQLVHAALVVTFLLLGYQKWFAYEVVALQPFIEHGPLTSWLYSVFDPSAASRFVGAFEWLVCLLLIAGFWSSRALILGALGACAIFVATVTTIPFMPGGWNQAVGGFPAMSGGVLLLSAQ
jgi:uncharacterized membrane protein YkgB